MKAIGKATKTQINDWKKEFGKIYELSVEDEDGEHFTYVKKPNIDTLSAVTKYTDTDPLKSLVIMFNGTRLGGSEKVTTDDELKLSTAAGLKSIFKMKAVKLKKL